LTWPPDLATLVLIPIIFVYGKLASRIAFNWPIARQLLTRLQVETYYVCAGEKKEEPGINPMSGVMFDIGLAVFSVLLPFVGRAPAGHEMSFSVFFALLVVFFLSLFGISLKRRELRYEWAGGHLLFSYAIYGILSLLDVDWKHLPELVRPLLRWAFEWAMPRMPENYLALNFISTIVAFGAWWIRLRPRKSKV